MVMAKEKRNLLRLLPEDAKKILALLNQILALKDWWVWDTKDAPDDQINKQFYITGRYPTGDITLSASFSGKIENPSPNLYSLLDIGVGDKNYFVCEADIYADIYIDDIDDIEKALQAICQQMIVAARAKCEAEEATREKARQDEILARKKVEGEEPINHLEHIRPVPK